jgi:hypothetical protein
MEKAIKNFNAVKAKVKDLGVKIAEVVNIIIIME